MEKPIPSVSLLSSLLNAKKLYNNPIQTIEDHLKDFETDSFRTYMGAKRNILISQNNKLAKHVLQKNHKNYHKSEIQSEILARFLGKGLLTINGSHWLKQRRLIQPGFHKANLESFLKIMHLEIKNGIEGLATRYQKEKFTIDLNHEMATLTMNVVSRALFSTQVDQVEIQFIGKSIDQLQLALSKDLRLPMFGWWRHLVGEERANNKIANKLYALIKKKIDYRKQNKEVQGDLLDMLLQVRYEESGEGMSDQQLLDEILVLYAAGYETTANALAWTFKLLCEHPEHHEALQKEVDSTDFSEGLRMETLFSLPMTAKVSAESLRLFPPIWIIDRVALDEDEIDGIRIHKGDIINIYILGLHRSEKHWKNPLEFNPDRFESDTHMKTDFTYLPFGGGPRLCIGYQFAKLEINLTLHYMLKHYKLRLDPKQTVLLKPLLTLKPKAGIRMILEKRS